LGLEVWNVSTGETEVAYFQIAVAVDEEIPRLEVSVEDAS
jgi:hypothetical protein